MNNQFTNDLPPDTPAEKLFVRIGVALVVTFATAIVAAAVAGVILLWRHVLGV